MATKPKAKPKAAPAKSNAAPTSCAQYSETLRAFDLDGPACTKVRVGTNLLDGRTDIAAVFLEKLEAAVR